jgi:acyl-coenzyme A thioesterase PaaI-like protein
VLRAGKSLIFVEAEVTAQRGDERVLVAKTSSTLAVIARDGGAT